MSSDADIPGSERPDAQAADWLLRVNAEDAAESDWLALEAWLAADPANLDAYERAEMLWSDIEAERAAVLQALPAEPPTAEVVDLASRRRIARAPMRRGFDWRAAAAAAVVLVAGGTAFFAVQPRSTAYETAKGQSRDVALADGSKLALNSGSKISVRFDSKARRVEMGDAEVAFDVAKDPARPFLIAAGDQQVRVVGTKFNILRHGGTVTVTVSRGVVEVRDAAGADGPARARLTPGMQLIHREGSSDSIVRTVDPADAFAWRQGRLVYRDAPLSAVADDLNRYFTVPVTVDAEAGRLTFTGVLVVDNEDAVVRRIQAFLPVEAHRTPQAITLRSSR